MSLESNDTIDLGHKSQSAELAPMVANNRSSRLGQRLHMWNCTVCRKDKKKCEPQGRKWPQKCERCEAKGLRCSPPARKYRKRKEDGAGTTNQIGDGEGNTHLQARSYELPSATEPSALSLEDKRQTWDLKDLSNALGMLQLVAAELVELEGAYHAARKQLPKHHHLIYRSLRDRLVTLTEFLNIFQRRLEFEVVSRLETNLDSNGKQLLEEALNTLADPLSGILMSPIIPPSYVDSRPHKLQIPVMADSLHHRAMALLADGKVSLGLIYCHKSIVYSKKQLDSSLSGVLKLYGIPKMMAITATKFGLSGDYTTPDFWGCPSIVLPSLLRGSEMELLETVLIKNWVGFNDSSSLIGNKMLGSGSADDWKRVFLQMCRTSTKSKTGLDGRTSLHLAVLLGMREEVDLLCRYPGLDIAKPDNDQRTALHLAAIVGNKAICDSLLSAGNASNSGVVIKDFDDRLPVWYAADEKKEEIFKKLMDATLRFKPFDEICSERDKDGKSLAQYGMAHGLAPFEFMKLVPGSQFPNPNHLRPTLYPVPYPDWQVPYPPGNILSGWATSQGPAATIGELSTGGQSGF